MTKYRTRGRPRKTPYDAVIVKQPTERLKRTVYNDTFLEIKNEEIHVPSYATPNTTHLLSLFSNFETFYFKRNSLCPAWQS